MSTHILNKLRGVRSEALERILQQVPDDRRPTLERPLGGKIHIEGVGYVTQGAIRRELERREA